jgi:O-methyltransferase
MSSTLKNTIRPLVPKSVLDAKRKFHYWVVDEERSVPLDVLRYDPRLPFPRTVRKELADKMEVAHEKLRCAHTHSEAVAIVSEILRVPSSTRGVVLEAGCFKGGSTAKLSLATKLIGRKLLVYDSFEGLPDVMDVEKDRFSQGEYSGALEEVKKNVGSYGSLEVCEFIRGWFDQTMPNLTEPVVVAFVDVDLRDSLETCLTYIYPRLVPGGTIFSHDGHLPICVDLMKDASFWNRFKEPAPEFEGLGTRKLVKIRKPKKS